MSPGASYRRRDRRSPATATALRRSPRPLRAFPGLSDHPSVLLVTFCISPTSSLSSFPLWNVLPTVTPPFSPQMPSSTPSPATSWWRRFHRRLPAPPAPPFPPRQGPSPSAARASRPRSCISSTEGFLQFRQCYVRARLPREHPTWQGSHPSVSPGMFKSRGLLNSRGLIGASGISRRNPTRF